MLEVTGTILLIGGTFTFLVACWKPIKKFYKNVFWNNLKDIFATVKKQSLLDSKEELDKLKQDNEQLLEDYKRMQQIKEAMIERETYLKAMKELEKEISEFGKGE